MKILIADDDPSFRHLLEEKVATWGNDVVVAENGDSALRILQSGDSPRIAILDWLMPGVDGVEVCRKVKTKMNKSYTYIILLTSRQSDEDLATGMEAGADDYITKPFKNNQLRQSLRAGKRIVKLQDELVAVREAFQKKAYRHSLYGLWNHQEILHILANELSRAEREEKSVGVIVAEIDYFKKLNDSYGHLTGDAVLRETAVRMLSMMRSYDFIGRYSAEGFLVVLPEYCIKCAAAFAERLRLCVNSETFDIPEGMIPVTISLGVTANCKDRKQDADALIKAAGEALSRAKENGGNCVEVAHPGAISAHQVAN